MFILDIWILEYYFILYFILSSYFYILLFFHPDILGNADNLIVANPLSTPDHIIPELYFLILFYLLRCIAFKFLGIICIASSFIYFLM